METLTPVQRVAVIAICLVLTLLIAMLLVPWVWTQIVERFPIAATPVPGALFLPKLPTTGMLARVGADTAHPADELHPPACTARSFV